MVVHRHLDEIGDVPCSRPKEMKATPGEEIIKLVRELKGVAAKRASSD
jgi:hypothetical protein